MEDWELFWERGETGRGEWRRPARPLTNTLRSQWMGMGMLYRYDCNLSLLSGRRAITYQVTGQTLCTLCAVDVFSFRIHVSQSLSG